MGTPRRAITVLCQTAATLAVGVGIAGMLSKPAGSGELAVAVGAAVLGLAVQGLAWRRIARGAPPPGPVLRVAFVAAVGLWLAYSLFAGRYLRGRVACVAIAWGAGVATSVWLTPRPSRGPRRMMLVLLAMSLLLAFAEVALRTLAWLAPGPLWARRTAFSAERLREHAFAAGQRHFDFPINADGCYDEPFAEPSTARGPVVAVVGDSFSVGVVPHAFHYTTVAEREHDVPTVWNVGWAGLAPPEYRHLIERIVLPRRADAVVVSLFLGNDLEETPPWNGIDRVLGDWFDRGNVLLFETPRRAWRLLRGVGEDAGFHQIGDLAAAQVWLHDPLREPGSFTPQAFIALETERALAACDAAHPSLPALLAELDHIRRLCSDRPLGFMLIPDEFMVEDGLWQQIAAAVPSDRSLGERWALRDRLVAWCREASVPCLDLLPVLRAVPPFGDGDRHLYLLRDTHWNARGNEVAGKALAPFVRELLRGR